VSVGFYPARDYQPLVEFGGKRRSVSKSIILKDKNIDTLAESLPMMLVSICNGGGTGAECVSGAFHLSPPKNFGSARLYFVTQCIYLTLLDLQYLYRLFHRVQQQLRDYALALPDVLFYVILSVTLATYVERVPNASDLIDYRHLSEELETAV